MHSLKLFIYLSFISMWAITLQGQIIPKLDWATYHGGSQQEVFRDMAIDAQGNIYVIGQTSSDTNIATPNSHQVTIAGATDIVISKYSNTGLKIWSTYYGGPSDDVGQSIDIDNQGNVFICGLTFSNSGIATIGSHRNTYSGGGDIFIAKFTTDGNRIWGSYLGGQEFDSGNDIEIDLAGNPVITGWTYSPSGISTVGSFQSTHGGQEDAFIAKFNTAGQLLWSTYHGSIGFDPGLQVESDGIGNIYISGWTSSMNNFTSTGAFQSVYGGLTSDAYICKFSPAGVRIWSTYYGGMGDDYADALLVTLNGDIYVGGSSNSPNNITTPNTHQSINNGSFDAVLAHFTTNGQRVWATYFGGTDEDTGYCIRQGTGGSIYMVGHTKSNTNIATPNALQTIYGGGWDVFISKFSGIGNLVWSTYFGGSGNDLSFGMVQDDDNDIYVTGYTASTSKITTNGAAQMIYGGGSADGFVAKFEACPKDFAKIISNDSTFCLGDTLQLNGSKAVTYNWSGPNGFNAIDQNTQVIDVNSIHAGEYLLLVSDSTFCTDTATIHIQIIPQPDASIIVEGSLCNNDTIILQAKGGITYTWNGPNNFQSDSQSVKFLGGNIANEGFYSVTITDSNMCTDTASVYIQQRSSITASIITPENICTGDTLQLLGDGGLNFRWEGPNGFSSTSQNPTTIATFLSQGTYSLTVTDIHECSATATTEIIVFLPPSANIESNSPVCSGNNLTLSVPDGFNYSWTGPNNYVSDLQSINIPTLTGTGTGIFRVTITDSNGCSSSSSFNAVVHPSPIATATSNGPICEGSSLELMALGGNSYLWAGPDNFSSAQQNPKIQSVQSAATGIYTVTVTDQNACSNKASIIISILAKSNISVSSNSPLCTGDTLQFNISGGISFQWTGPQQFSSNIKNPFIADADTIHSGVYNITILDNLGCSKDTSLLVNINKRPIAKIIGPDSLCLGEQIRLFTDAIGNIRWNTNQTNPFIDVQPTQTSTYSLSVFTNGCSDSISKIIHVKPIPSLQTSAPITIHKGEAVGLFVNGGDNYIWKPNSFISCTNCEAPIVNPEADIEYCVEGNINGCKTESCIMITVNERCDIVLPNIISSNGDNSNDEWCSISRACVTNQILHIYDRWGNILYSDHGPEVCWNPVKNNPKLQNQIVVYLLQIEMVDGKNTIKTGDILISK